MYTIRPCVYSIYMNKYIRIHMYVGIKYIDIYVRLYQ